MSPYPERLRGLRANLGETLFPGPAPRAATLKVWEAALVIGALLVLAVILQALRIGPAAAFDSLWAEDGQVFLQGAMTSGFVHNLFATYAGYLVFVPRLIGEIGNAVPLKDAPAAITIASGLVVGLSGLAVWFGSSAHLRNPYLRGVLVTLTVLPPVASLESIASGAYVLWYMFFASFWLLLWRPATTRGAALGGAFLLATGMSTPGIWFFAPLAGLRLLALRDRRDALILGGYTLGAAIQLPVVALNTEPQVTPEWTREIWTAYIQRVVDGAALGDRVGGIGWAHLGWPFLIALLALAAIGLVVGLRRADATARYLAAIALPTSLVMFVASAYQRAVGLEIFWPSGTHFTDGGRYVIVPALLLLSAAFVLIDRVPHPAGSNRLPTVGIATVSVVVIGLAGSFYQRIPEGRGEPKWSAAVDAAATSCRSEGLTEVTIPTSPPGFGVVVACDQLR